MLLKLPHPSFNQFVMSLEKHEQTLISQEEEHIINLDHAQAFLSLKGKNGGPGNGGYFKSQGRDFAPASLAAKQNQSMEPSRRPSNQ